MNVVQCQLVLGWLLLVQAVMAQPVYESDIVIIPTVKIENKDAVELALRDLLEDCSSRRISVKPKYWQKCEKLNQCIERVMDTADNITTEESSSLLIDPRALRLLKQPLTLIVITDSARNYPELANYSVKYIVVGGNKAADGGTMIISGDSLVVKDAEGIENIDEIESMCTAFPKKRIQGSGTSLYLRIHVGFGNISEEGLQEVKDLINKFIHDPRMVSNAGMVHIRGPRETNLAKCSWNSYCDMKSINLEDVQVTAGSIFKEDMDYAPEVIQFLNWEYHRDKENKMIYLLLLQDFISPLFHPENQGYVFENAEQKHNISVGMGIFLEVNGVTEGIVKDYYGEIDYIDIYTANKTADLSPLMDDIMSNLEPVGNTTDPTDSTEPNEVTKKPMTTVSPILPTEHNMIIVFAVSPWTSVKDFDLMKMFIVQRSSGCIPEHDNIGVWDGRTNIRTPLCNTTSCVEAQVSSLPYIWPNNFAEKLAEQLGEAVARLKSTFEPKNPVLPKLVLFTNYAPESFLKSYEDPDGVFRKKLSTVDFQVIVVNKTEVFHNKLSVSNTHIHQFDTVDDLVNDQQNPFCQKLMVDEPTAAPPSNHITTIIIAVSALLLIILLVIVYRMMIYIKELVRKTEINEIDKKSLMECQSFNLEDFPQPLKNGKLGDWTLFGQMSEDPWEMSRQKIIQREEIGRGNSSIVYRGSLLGRAPCEFIYRKYFFAYQFDNLPVAIKMQIPPSSQLSRRQLLDEIEILKSIPPHMNIANMLGCDTSINPVCIVVELANEGSMKEFLKGKHIESTAKLECDHDLPDTVCRKNVLSFLWQICDGLAFIHASGVLHRDVAARNILVQKDRNILISDFGLAIWKEEERRSKGTEFLPIKWMSPESLSKGIFTPATDVWSFGICAWEILSGGEEPFSQVQTQEFLAYLNAGKRLNCPEACSPQLWNILSECWNEDAEKRPSMSSLRDSIGKILDEMSSYYGYLDLTAMQHVE